MPQTSQVHLSKADRKEQQNIEETKRKRNKRREINKK